MDQTTVPVRLFYYQIQQFVGKHFLDDKGHLSKEMMPDTTHPSEKGHEVWAKAIESELVRIVGR